MDFQLHIPQAIHELGKRKNQEDTIFPLPGEATSASRVFLVCDGMGGYDKGEVASAAVCQSMSSIVTEMIAQTGTLSDTQFQQALSQAYVALDAADKNHEAKMGTTMTFACLHKGGCMVAHIGDSRIYHLRPSTGEVLYRSHDHSLVQQLYDLGEISYNDIASHPRRNIILRAMQPFQDERSKAELVHITNIQAGDYLYLCSDGMLEQMDDDELLSIVGSNISDEEKKQELIRRTIDNSDNHSAYLIHIKNVVCEHGDELLYSDEEIVRKKNKALNDPYKDKAWDSEQPPVQAPHDNSTVGGGAVPLGSAKPVGTRKWPLAPVIAAIMMIAIIAAMAYLFIAD